MLKCELLRLNVNFYSKQKPILSGEVAVEKKKKELLEHRATTIPGIDLSPSHLSNNVMRVKSDEEQPFFRIASDTPINRKNVRSNGKGMPRNRVACQRFTQYLSRREKISIGSDHKPLRAIFKKS